MLLTKSKRAGQSTRWPLTPAARDGGTRASLPASRAGLSTLFFTELWERFSYYGMRALLVLFMVAPMAAGGLGLTTIEAARIYGNYTMAVYMLSIPGGFIADRYLGAHSRGADRRQRHRAAAISRWRCRRRGSFYVGLVLVALGTGLFKPNISAMVGGLYATEDERRDAGFSIFYMGINIGAFIGAAGDRLPGAKRRVQDVAAGGGFDPADSWHWGFGAAGVGMTLGLIVLLRCSAKRLGNVGRAARRRHPARGAPACSSSPARWRSWR